MSRDKKPNRFLDGAKERRAGAIKEPGRGGLTRIDVEGAVRYEGARPITVEVFGEVLAVGEDGLVHAKGAVFQLTKLNDRDCLVPVGATDTSSHR
jgi:hypothetical protein